MVTPTEPDRQRGDAQRPDAKRSAGRPTPGDTRQALLDAGLRLLAADPAAGALSHLKAGRVAGEAGRTTGAFFHHWPSQEDYALDLIDYAFRPERAESLGAVQADLAEGLEAGREVGEALLSACRTALDSIAVEPQTAIEFLVWKRASTDPAFGAWVADRYRELDAAGAPLFTDLIALTGRQVRPPFTVETAAALVTAVAHGLVLRHAVERQTYPPDILGWVVLALLPLITAPSEDHRHAAEIAAALAVEALGPTGGT